MDICKLVQFDIFGLSFSSTAMETIFVHFSYMLILTCCSVLFALNTFTLIINNENRHGRLLVQILMTTPAAARGAGVLVSHIKIVRLHQGLRKGDAPFG